MVYFKKALQQQNPEEKNSVPSPPPLVSSSVALPGFLVSLFHYPAAMDAWVASLQLTLYFGGVRRATGIWLRIR